MDTTTRSMSSLAKARSGQVDITQMSGYEKFKAGLENESDKSFGTQFGEMTGSTDTGIASENTGAPTVSGERDDNIAREGV